MKLRTKFCIITSYKNFNIPSEFIHMLLLEIQQLNTFYIKQHYTYRRMGEKLLLNKKKLIK